MEIRARYLQVGAFALVVMMAAFLFVYWLHNAGGLRNRAMYRVRFDGSVSGLLGGSAVLFNGIRVGEVTRLQLDPRDPRQVMATIAVEQSTPVRGDTHVAIDFQGLAGAPVISLRGGSPTSQALSSAEGGAPLLVADSSASQSMTQAAREALRKIDTVVAENAEPLRAMIANLNTFSAALARNSERIDGIATGLERMTGSARKPSPVIYDLTAPRDFPAPSKTPREPLIIPEPTTLVVFETQNIIVRPSGGDVAPSALNAQWSDSLPKLVQAKLIESFENSNYLRGVGRPAEGLTADYQLLIDIRSFQVSMAPEPAATVELAAKIMGKGRMIQLRVFRTSVKVGSADAAVAAAALNEAFGKVAAELVPWVSGSL